MSIDERNEPSTGETTAWSVSRRGLFATAAGGAAAVAAVAVMTGGASAHQPEGLAGRAPHGPVRATPGAGDLGIANVAAGLEVLAVATYQAALDAAGSGALPDVPPAVAEFVTTARDQHQAHLEAWNGVLTAAGQAAVSQPPAELAQFVNGQFARVTNVAGAAQLALWLEQVAADTYLFAISELESTDAIALAGSIFPTDRQHQSVLLFVLGMYPVPQTFATTELKFTGDGQLPPGATAPETR